MKRYILCHIYERVVTVCNMSNVAACNMSMYIYILHTRKDIDIYDMYAYYIDIHIFMHIILHIYI